MKKKVLKTIVGSLLIFTVSFTLNVEQSEAGTRGNTYSVSENSNCASGLMHRCTGEGDLCNTTIGWDCTQPKKAEITHA